jgi:hypothetical protein
MAHRAGRNVDLALAEIGRGGGHYLNRPGELRGVLELIRAHRDRLEQCVPLVDALRTILLTPPTEGRETIVGLRLGVPFPG